MDDLSGRAVTVMGLGNFGGGLGAARWLAARGADVLVTDMSPPEKLADSLEVLQPLIASGRVRTRLGEHNVSDFTTPDLVVANPAVPTPWDNRFLRSALAAGIPVTTEMRLLTERLPERGRTIGITGTAGKSTTTAMIVHALRGLGEPVFLGGNIGGSLLMDLGSISARDWVVLEVSSAMLYWLDEGVGFAGASGWSPHVAVVTNIAPNHVDWHGGFDHYARSKRVITKFQRSGDVLVLAAADDSAAPGNWALREGIARRAVQEPAWYESKGLTPRLKLPGRHNRVNALTAAETVASALMPEAAGDDPRRLSLLKEALSTLSNFGGLAHRLQYVTEIRLAGGGRAAAFNDSKSTTPESSALAVAALDEDPRFGASRVHLIAGGYDKKVDLSGLARAAARCAGVYTIGATGPAIAAAVGAAGGRAIECGTLEKAVDVAKSRLSGGDALLLSPACASWDQFTHFEKRGEAFVKLVGG